MKFLFALFAASVGYAAAQAGDEAATDATDLATRWNLDEDADVGYTSADNSFTITYTGASTSFTFPEMQEEFYDINCKDDGSGFKENVVRKYFTDPTSGLSPAMVQAANDVPKLKFKIDTAEMAKDPLVYTVLTAKAIQDLKDNQNAENPVLDITGREGQGMMRFCVRGGLGYADKSSDDYKQDILNNPAKSLLEVIAAGYVEVNFIESLVTIFYDLTADFKVDGFNVDPKERVETTEAKEAYELEAWLCEAGSNMETRDSGVEAPKAISANFNEGAGSPEYFNQGALITVCVAPKKAAFADGIRMNGITSFDWKRDDFGTAFTNNLNSLPTDAVTQEAIEAGAASGNLLTSYITNTCEGGKDYCRFSSILFADFYITTGVVSGTGDAKLTFKGSRRLGESSSRQLQADEGAASPFDLQVPVDITDTGPAGLKTAAGVSFAASTFTMAVALIGAALLA